MHPSLYKCRPKWVFLQRVWGGELRDLFCISPRGLRTHRSYFIALRAFLMNV